MDAEWRLLTITGAVQGVGFRPTLYRVARDMNLTGTVSNTSAGVSVHLFATPDRIEALLTEVRRRLPAAARIDRVDNVAAAPLPPGCGTPFAITASRDECTYPTDVAPDIAICPECLADIEAPGRRHDYYLTNCTRCGPRFSIVRDLPYDRPVTSMAGYKMCGGCAAEYSDPDDRRYHAQPVACADCGPRYRMKMPDGTVITDPAEIARMAARMLLNGTTVICKSLGGYNMMTDATNAGAVKVLRDIKHRERKPFAVMVANLTEARRIAPGITRDEELTLTDWSAPIVVVDAPESGLPAEVAPGCRTLGLMLPYMGFQHRLCRLTGRPLIMTSANRPGQPIIIDDDDADRYAADLGLPLISFNREIINRQDDSVVRIADGRRLLLRRSRGFAPRPVPTGMLCHGIIGTGADITAQWAFGRGTDIIQSPYIGSLVEAAAEDAWIGSYAALSRLWRITPVAVVTDMHPGYTSRRLGRQLAEAAGVPMLAMQHHHAHAVSVMADRNLTGEVLAIVLDGTGYGPDGTIWGAELLRCSRTEFRRLCHGHYLPMPGGDAASHQGWRMAVSWVLTATGSTDSLPSHLREAVGTGNIDNLARMIHRGINSPLTCGAGRMWDAVAALTGVAYQSGYDSEAPILLENAAIGIEADPYPIDRENPTDLLHMVNYILHDLEAGTDPRVIAARWHRTYATAWAEAAARAAHRERLDTVVLSGGVMQNSLLVSLLCRELSRRGLRPVLPDATPCGDAGIAVGQVLYAAERLNINNHNNLPDYA